MIVNFIGVDKTGKTTLIDEVAQELEWPIIRYKAPFSDALIKNNVQTVLTRHEENRDLSILYERWNYPEDLIYGPVVEGSESVLDLLTRQIERRLLKIGCLFVYTTATLQVINRRMRLAGGDYYIKLKHVPLLRKAYLSFLKQTSIPTLQVDTTNRIVEENVDIIMTKIREMLKQ